MIVHGIDPERIEGVVLDLGGVFLAGGVEVVASFGARHGLTDEMWRAMRHELFAEEGLWSSIERGERPLEHFVARLCELVLAQGGTVSPEDARDFMQNTGEQAQSRLRHEIVEATARLHARIPTALLTNNIPEWRDSWRGLLELENLFDVVVDSCEVGTRKPEQRIYELTRAKLGLPHHALFFVDDLGVNLKAARALGWQTLRYDDTARVLEVLNAIAATKPLRGR